MTTNEEIEKIYKTPRVFVCPRCYAVHITDKCPKEAEKHES